MRLSILWRIIEIEEGVIRWGHRPRLITPSEISIILHMIQKPNLTIVLWGGHNGGVWTPQHCKKFCRTPHHGKKSWWITVTAISIFSLMILASVQDKAFKILPLTLRKSLKQHITRPNMMEAKFRTDKLQNGNCNTADNFVSPNTADFKT